MVPVDICGVVLGSPYLYDRDVVFYRREHKYHLKKEGVEFFVRAHKFKSNLDLIVTNQVKQFTSSSKYVVMFIKEQHKINCSRCEIQFIDQLVKVVNSFPRNLIHKHDKQHEIHLMSYEHLLKDRMNLNSFIQLNSRNYHHQQCIVGIENLFQMVCLFSVSGVQVSIREIQCYISLVLHHHFMLLKVMKPLLKWRGI